MILSKKFAITTLISVLIVLLTASLLVAYVDPFWNYRIPDKSLAPYYRYEQLYDVYWKIGMAKHAEGDSIWVGSSLSTHFNKEEVDSSLGTNCATGIIASGRYNIYEIFIRLFMKNNKVKNVFYEFTPAHLYTDYDVTRIPKYMETNTIFDDTEYLFNKGVFIESANVLKNKLSSYFGKSPKTIVEPKEEKIIEKNAGYGMGILAPRVSSNIVEASYEDILKTYAEYEKTAYEKIDNYIVPLIKESPQTKFVFFVPPCSYITPYTYYNSNKPNQDYLAVYSNYQKAVIKHLLNYNFNNVELYYFWQADDFCSNLDNYLDEGHYNPDGASLMVNGIRDKKYLVTLSNIDEVFEKYNYSVSMFKIPFLKKRFRGQEVEELQSQLRKLGYDITEDGYFSQTEDAVKDFQKHNGISITGIAFPETRELIKELANKK
jgi:hypothetical protein